jgi:hypothetical protein
MKRIFHFFKYEMHRHRKFQLAITTGTIGCAAGGFLIPSQQELLLVAGLATNLLWIWEQ